MKLAAIFPGFVTCALVIFINDRIGNISLTKMANTGDGNSVFRWQQAMPPGNGSFPGNWIPGQWLMAVLPLNAFDDNLYMIGDKMMWVSTDGIQWSGSHKTDWCQRSGMAFAWFKGELYMSGGMKSWDRFYNDVWSTADGKQWQSIVSNASWSPRRGHNMVVQNNKLWLIGGKVSSGRADQLPTEFLNDVWSSDDGIEWRQEISHAPWAGRWDHSVLVFQEKFLMIGTDQGDVWSSKDGKDWNQLTKKAEWEGRFGGSALVFGNQLWVFAGVGMNDVWYSNTGTTWSLQSPPAPWSRRTADYSVVFRDKLWIYSGKTGREDSWSGDIWTMSKEK